MKITFIQTGGSIDKDYPRVTMGYAFEIGEAAVKRILEQFKPNFEYEVVPLMQKDSLDMIDADREKIYQTCKNAGNKIIITHGTDMMIKTAEKLSGIRDKVIILTGATKPERFKDSDAVFNIGTAIGAANVVENGVYISMNGRVYAWNKVDRNMKTGKFVEK
jgi:L-asparaginase